jgi:DNA mismatch endonuclease (patch repair protein)
MEADDPPRNNAAWWGAKLAANVARDPDTDRQLEAAGWTSLRFWEHEVERSVDDYVDVVVQAARVTP